MLRRTRVNYWSHGWLSKLTAKLLGAPARPKWGSMEEWDAFHKNQVRNFYTQEVVEDVLDTLQNIWKLPADIYHSIYVYIRNRFVDKLHVLQTNLNPGKYYEYETRLLYGMFNSFVRFIEEDQTLDNLKWELTLTNDYEWSSDKEDAAKQPDYGKPSPQAISAQEKMALYTWWKVTRPARVRGYELSGFAKWSEENKGDDDGVFSLFVDDGDEEKKQTRKALTKKWHEFDEQHEQEDEDMMVRLIRIRRTIWT